MYSFKLTIICLLLSCVQLTYAQNIDSLLNIRKHTTSNLKKYKVTVQLAEASKGKQQWKNLLTYSNEALQIARLLKDDNLIGNTYLLFGRIYLVKGEYLKADSLFLKGLQYGSDKDLKAKLYSGRYAIVIRTGKLEDAFLLLKSMRSMITDTTSLLMGRYYFNTSGYYGEQHETLNCLKYLQKAKKLFLLHDQDIRNINHDLTIVFESLKDYESILRIQTELRKSAKKAKYHYAELFSLYGIMAAQKGLKDYEKAKRSCYDAINLKNTHQFSMSFGYVYFILGTVHAETEQLDSAVYYFRKGIEISEKQKEETQLSENHAAMAALLFGEGKIQPAKFHAERALSMIQYNHPENNGLLAKIYVTEGKYQKAYDLLNINWLEVQKKEEDRTDYKVIASLLSNKFEQEKAQEKLIFEQELNKQQQLLIGGVLAFSLILLTVIILIQTRNNRQLKRLNEQLYQQNNALQQFSYIASHDIKEPIRSIGNYIGLVRKKIAAADEEKLGLYFDNIKSGLQQVYTLIEDVMQYTQISQNETLVLKAVNIDKVIKNIEIGLGTFIEEKKAKIIYTDLPIIQSSSSMLFMILKNLIQNSLKFNHSEVPTIKIDYNKTKTHHEIIVSDNGIGIDKNYHGKVFEMFKKLNNKEAYEGSGIGLAIVKLSVDKLNGEIILDSEVGKGSRFLILLPQ
jgi:signal transduction histidine kinase